MKRIFLAFLLACFAPLCAAGGSPVTFDYERGKDVAQIFQKPMLLCFLASDECLWSQRFLAEFIHEDSFSQAIKNELIFIAIDFPKLDKQNIQTIETNHRLKEQFRVSTFPTFVLLSSDGEEITRLSFPASDPKHFAEQLLSYYDEYIELFCALSKCDSHEIKSLYRRALILNAPNLIQMFLEKGLKETQDAYFMIEKYMQYIKEGKRESHIAKQLRRKLMKLKGEELSQVKMRLAISDFQIFHQHKPYAAVSTIYRLLDTGQLQEKELIKLNQLLASHFIHEHDYLTAKRFALRLKSFPSMIAKQNGEELLNTIEQMSDKDHKAQGNSKKSS